MMQKYIDNLLKEISKKSDLIIRRDDDNLLSISKNDIDNDNEIYLYFEIKEIDLYYKNIIFKDENNEIFYQIQDLSYSDLRYYDLMIDNIINFLNNFLIFNSYLL